MNKKQIQERLIENYDELTVRVLTNSILEFQKLFNEKYCSTPKVIERVIKNIPKGIVIYDNSLEKFDAVCSMSSGEFKVDKSVISESDYFSYVFFHEFLHAISYVGHHNMQFMGFYTIDKGNDYTFKSTSFNEAFTEFITFKRNKMCQYEPKNRFLSGYDVGACQLDLLTKVIPEHELINCYFNAPDNLENVFKKYNMNIDEIFYTFYAYEGKEYDIKAMENRRGLDNVNDVYKIIDGERYFYYNLLDAFGEIKTEVEFNNKWKILLSEFDNKYNFYLIDGIFRYGELVNDLDKLKIKDNSLIKDKISQETIDKYRLLNSIFDTNDKMKILIELNKIYCNDYNKYYDLLKDSFAVLAYTFLNSIKNNYQLYDIEIYPRVYPYLINENALIDDVQYEKVICEEEKIKFYIFKINKNTYVQSNYDDTIVNKINNNKFEVKYGNNTGLLNLSDKSYIFNGVEYKVKVIY